MGFDHDLFSKGAEAELTILNPEESWIFRKSHIQSRSSNSPYVAHSLTGKIKYTIIKGHITALS